MEVNRTLSTNNLKINKMDNKEHAAKMYPELRDMIIDEFGTTAVITNFYVWNSQRRNKIYYVACIEAFGRVVCAAEPNLRDVVAKLRYNYDNDYSDVARRVDFLLSEEALAEMS